MFLQNTFLSALLGLSAALLSNNAQAQSTNSSSPIKPRIVVAQVKDSIKARPKFTRIICRSTLPAGNSPLYIVDENVVTEQDAKLINPNDIDKLEVMKGIAAEALYGSRAANGVILITMKHAHTKPTHQPITKKGRLD